MFHSLFKGNLSYALLFWKILTCHSRIPFFQEAWNKKKGQNFPAKIFMEHLSWAILREGSPSLTSQVAKSSPKVAAHPPRPAALGKSVDSENHRFVVENSTESHEGLPFFFFQIYMLLNVLEQFFQHFVKSPETRHFHLYTTFVTLWHAFFEYVIKDTL